MNADWEVKKLGEVVTQINGLWKGKREPFINVAVIRNTNFSKDCKLILDDIEYLDVEERQYKSRKLQFGDIIIEKSGGSEKQPVGRPILFNIREGNYSFSNFTSTLRINEISKISAEYLHLYLYFRWIKGDTRNIQSHTTGIHNLDFKSYLNFDILVPPLAEQKRIVEILDQKSVQIDQLKQNAEKNLQNAKELFQAELTKAFSNDTWEKKRLGDCTSIIGDGLHGTPKYDENGNYYFINGSNLTVRDIVFTPETKRVNETEYQKYKVKLNENTVFISINGSTLGKRTAFYNNEPVILGKSACYINVKENTLNKFYLRYFFSSNIFQEYAWKEKTGTAIPNLGLKAMRDLQIPLPPLSEQQKIVAHLDALQEKVRQLEEIYTKQIANCDELKQSFLKKAFEGEL